MRFLYSLLFYSLLPIIFLRLWRKSAKASAYKKRWGERLGYVKPLAHDKPRLWFHTVSVGEFLAARPLIQHYLEQEKYDILVTTMTPTGSDRVIATFGEHVAHCYCPYDIPLAVQRFLARCKPTKLICLETELWPNLIHFCRQNNTPVILANARMSEKSARTYKKISWLAKPMLQKLTVAAIQNEGDAQRLTQLGLDEKQQVIVGNIKYDLEISPALEQNAATLKKTLSANGEHPLWIAASTRKGEDEILLDAFSQVRKRHPKLRLLIVPRHPERFDTVVDMCQSSGFLCQRRTQYNGHSFDVLVGDTMGELLLLLGTADIAFVGGSLVNTGGHNYIEPAAWALPILSGPSTFNFREVAASLVRLQSLVLCENAEALAKSLNHYLDNPEDAKQKGQCAKHFADQNRGALERVIRCIDASEPQ